MKDPENLICFLNALGKRIKEHETDIAKNMSDVLLGPLKIQKDKPPISPTCSFDPKFGARPLKRAIQKYFEDPLSEEIINAQIKEGDTIKVNLSKEKTTLEMKIVKPKAKPKKKLER